MVVLVVECGFLRFLEFCVVILGGKCGCKWYELV